MRPSVLVTGASGFIGSHLVRALVDRGHDVTAVVRRGRADRVPLNGRVSVVAADLRDLGAVEGALQERRCEVVVHLAWEGIRGEARRDPRQLTVNVPATARLLEIGRHATVRHWIGFGSQAEYGDRDGILRESTPTTPVDAYGVAKLVSGVLTRELCDAWGIQWTWLRLFAAYGPGDVSDWLIPTLIRRLLRGERAALTFGEQRWDLIYVDDLVDAVIGVIDRATAGTFNLGSGEAPSVREIAETVRDAIDPSLVLGFGDIPIAPGRPARSLLADVSAFMSATGWHPRTNARTGLIRTVEWSRERGVAR